MTDPSYKGQFVVFTHPHIGNVGINDGEHQQHTTPTPTDTPKHHYLTTTPAGYHYSSSSSTANRCQQPLCPRLLGHG